MALERTSLMAEFEPLSATIQLTCGWSSVNRAVSAWTAGSAPPPPLAVYVPESGSGVDAAGPAPHAETVRRARTIPARRTAPRRWFLRPLHTLPPRPPSPAG